VVVDGRRWEGESEDVDGGMNFWVKTRFEVSWRLGFDGRQ
jgi:hypothetical protein